MSETPEAKSRRRWITLGEVVGVLALVVSGLSYWDSRRDHTEVAATSRPAAPLVLTGSVDAARDRIDLRAASGGHVIQTQTLRFPAAVRADAVETTGNPRIEAAWFAAGLRSALRAAKITTGRHRLAVGIETVYLDGDVRRTDRAVYDIGYSLNERFLRPDAVDLDGVSLVRARVGADLQRRVDARFAAQAG